MLYFCVVFLLYTIRINLLNDYTFAIKEGIKNGYFEIQNKNKLDTPLKEHSNKLLERLIVYSIVSNKNGNNIENYNTLNFNLDIMDTYYKMITDSTNNTLEQDVFIKEYIKSLKAFFIYEENNEEFIFGCFEYYLKNFLLETLIDNDTNKYLNEYLILSTFIVILNNRKMDTEQSKEYLIMLLNYTKIINFEYLDDIIKCIYIVLFWQYSNQLEIYDSILCLNDIFQYMNLSRTYNESELINIFNLTHNVLKIVYQFPEKYLIRFKNEFYLIINYANYDFYRQYFRYEMEVK